MAKSNEAFFWSLFSAGGVAAALFIPAIIVSTGFLLPTHDPAAAAERAQKVHGVVAHPITKIVLMGVIFLAFFHCAHRIQHTSKDLGLRAVGGLVAVLSYLGALAGSIVAAVLLWRV
jgi:fumarate reductase subunit D